MSVKDLTAHSHGRRHRLALSKVDADLRVELESACLAPMISHGQDIQGSGGVGSDKPASTALASTSAMVSNVASPRIGSSALRGAVTSASSTKPLKQGAEKTKRPRKAKQPKSTKENVSHLSLHDLVTCSSAITTKDPSSTAPSMIYTTIATPTTPSVTKTVGGVGNV